MVQVDGPQKPPIVAVSHAVPSTVQIARASASARDGLSTSSGTPPGRVDARMASRSVSASHGVPAAGSSIPAIPGTDAEGDALADTAGVASLEVAAAVADGGTDG